ncbi:MAG: nicotinate-nucleotide adenylyltransferase, partial [Fimbriimonadaceae bacterium]|nr:nicotinate-nucleotide adenylyltransferase [Fimbriimonadaceae bacterium]
PADYWFIVGADALKDLDKWKQLDRLLKLTRLAVAVRPPLTETQVVSRIPERIRDLVDLVKMSPVDIASFDIRDRLARQKPVAPLLPDRVIDYIRQNDLYRS